MRLGTFELTAAETEIIAVINGIDIFSPLLIKNKLWQLVNERTHEGAGRHRQLWLALQHRLSVERKRGRLHIEGAGWWGPTGIERNIHNLRVGSTLYYKPAGKQRALEPVLVESMGSFWATTNRLIAKKPMLITLDSLKADLRPRINFEWFEHKTPESPGRCLLPSELGTYETQQILEKQWGDFVRDCAHTTQITRMPSGMTTEKLQQLRMLLASE